MDHKGLLARLASSNVDHKADGSSEELPEEERWCSTDWPPVFDEESE